MKKKILSLLSILLTFLMVCFPTWGLPQIGIDIDGEQILFSKAGPYKDQNNRTMIPLRIISEKLGAKVVWDDPTQTVHISKDGEQVLLQTGDTEGSQAVVKEETTFVPVRFVSESLGANVAWDEEAQRVSITSNNPIAQLVHVEHFNEGALEHILEGEINRNGKASGFHYEGLSTAKGKVIEGSVSEPDPRGVYTAQVEIEDQAKASNGGYSTFYPKTWTAQQVVDAINTAYGNKVHKVENEYYGYTEEKIKIVLYLDETDGKIISAFPIYSK